MKEWFHFVIIDGRRHNAADYEVGDEVGEWKVVTDNGIKYFYRDSEALKS